MVDVSDEVAQSPAELHQSLGVTIDDELLVLALTHRSFANNHGHIPSNERLEFLGDSVLGLVITERLFLEHPDLSEGDLARLRAATVSQAALASVARDLGVGRYILLDHGENKGGGRDKDSILSDTLEALIGAVFLSRGMATTKEFINRIMDSALARASGLGAGLDWKTSLQELAAQQGRGVPQYKVDGTGPDHARHFIAHVSIDDDVVGTGQGTSKKAAEVHAARQAHEALSAPQA